jgi:hypothetical protein
MSAAVAGPTFRPTPSYTTLRDVTRGVKPTPEMLKQIRDRAEQSFIAQRMHDKVLQEPAQVAARLASRTKFRGLGRDRAIELARQNFTDFMFKPAGGDLARGKVADGYSSDYAAWFKGTAPGGANDFVVSGLPLRVKDDSGQLAPVDTRLRDSGSAGWKPANPVKPYVVAAKSDAGVDLVGEGVTVAPGGGSVAGVAADDTIFFANTDTDTDTLVKPLPTGVEYTWQLRSASSPEALTLNVKLPAGASLGRVGQHGVSIIKDGKAVATIGRPVAVDANGTTVDTRLSVDGDTVSVSIKHRDKDLAYPIAVDPEVIANFNFPSQGTGQATPGDPYYYWAPTTAPASSTSTVATARTAAACTSDRPATRPI